MRSTTITSISCPILIVDDDPLFRRMLERYLVDAGHEVHMASNGKEAMKKLLRRCAQLVVTDRMMPEMDGLELCRAIRTNEDLDFIYVVILTAEHSTERIVEAFEAGADDFLAKPFNREELLARLRAGFRIITLQADLDRRNREVHYANAKLASAARELERANRRLRLLATIDELTGLLNRREAMDRLARHWSDAEKHKVPLSCVLLDIDHFKVVNDTYGHATGDVVLKGVVTTLLPLCRHTDSLCRIGGEEFLLICPMTTGEEAMKVAERMRNAIECTPLRHRGKELRVTVSLGVAEKCAVMHTLDDLLLTADMALYAAKTGGRNLVRLGAPADRRAEVANLDPDDSETCEISTGNTVTTE